MALPACSLLLSVLLLVLVLHAPLETTAQENCPANCSCFGLSVSCFKFNEDTLTKLPSNANEVLLTGGSIRRWPSNFLHSLPLLTFLEIQSTQVEVISSGAFADAEGLDQVTIRDCHIGVIESGAFRNLTTVLQFQVSGSDVATIRPGAFSQLHDFGDFTFRNSRVGHVEQGAFRNLSEFGAFVFTFNNVTTLDKGAISDVGRFGVVDVNMNVFQSLEGEAVSVLAVLGGATEDLNVYSNRFVCDCSVVRLFQRPEMARFLAVQKCVMPGQEEVLQLAEVAADGSCVEHETAKTTFGGNANLATSTTPGSVNASRPVKPTQRPNPASTTTTRKYTNHSVSTTTQHGHTALTTPRPAVTSHRDVDGGTSGGKFDSDHQTDDTSSSDSGCSHVATTTLWVFLLPCLGHIFFSRGQGQLL